MPGHRGDDAVGGVRIQDVKNTLSMECPKNCFFFLGGGGSLFKKGDGFE